MARAGLDPARWRCYWGSFCSQPAAQTAETRTGPGTWQVKEVNKCEKENQKYIFVTVGSALFTSGAQDEGQEFKKEKFTTG